MTMGNRMRASCLLVLVMLLLAIHWVISDECDTGCDPGKYCDGSDCANCEKGQYTDQRGQTSCKLCIPGKYQNHEKKQSCKDCRSGKYSSEHGKRGCKKCPIGKYQGSTQQTSCIICSQSTYTDQDEASECKQCPAGRQVWDDGVNVLRHDHVDDCNVCSGGQYRDTTTSFCIPCPKGRYNPSSGTDASKHDTIDDCKECPVGKYQNEKAQVACDICTTGKFSSSEAAENCEPCLAGRFLADDAQDASQHDNEEDCTKCIAGKTSLTGAGQCTICPSGKYKTADDGGYLCQLCAKGRFLVDHMNAVEAHDEAADCQSCAPGFYGAEEGKAHCDSCVAGQYQDIGEAQSCKDCPAGKSTLLTGRSVCSICAVGTYQALAGRATCENCPTGKFLENGKEGTTLDVSLHNDALDCLACPAGQYNGQAAQSLCTVCSMGQYSSEEGQTTSSACKVCPPGKYGINSRMSCALCPEGTYSNVDEQHGSEACKSCVGALSTPDRTQCSSCNPNEYILAGVCTPCTACVLGQEKTDCGGTSAGSCTACSMGRFNDVTSVGSFCKLCPRGKQSNVALSACVSCPASRAGTGAGQCKTCPAPQSRPGKGRLDCVSISDIALNNNPTVRIGESTTFDVSWEGVRSGCVNFTIDVRMCPVGTSANYGTACYGQEHGIISWVITNKLTATLTVPTLEGSLCPKSSISYFPWVSLSQLQYDDDNAGCILEGPIDTQDVFSGRTVFVPANAIPTISKITLSPAIIYPTTLSFHCFLPNGIEDLDPGGNRRLEEFYLVHFQGSQENVRETLILVKQNSTSGMGIQLSWLDPALGSKVECQAKPTDGCQSGVSTNGGSGTAVRPFELAPSIVSVAGGETITIKGDGFILNRSYTISLTTAEPRTQTTRALAVNRTTLSLVAPQWYGPARDTTVSVTGLFWTSAGCLDLSSLSPDETHHANGIYACSSKCLGKPMIALQGTACRCYAHGDVDIPSLLSDPSKCASTCTEDGGKLDLCGGSGGHFSLYAWGNEKTVITESLTMTMAPPETPTTFIIETAGAQTATLSWGAPLFTGGGAIAYDIFVDESSYGSVEIDGTKAYLTGLLASTTYTFSIQATNVKGSSSKISVTGSTHAPALPGPPSFSMTQTSFVHSEDKNLVAMTVHWLPPEDDGGSPIEGYQHKKESSGACGLQLKSVFYTVGKNTLSHTYIGLVPESTYTVFVRAFSNASGIRNPGPIASHAFSIPGKSNAIAVDGENGNDSSCEPCADDGSCTKPCKTLTMAFTLANVVGQIIRVKKGTYEVNQTLIPQTDSLEVVAMEGSAQTTISCIKVPCFGTNGTLEDKAFFPSLISGFHIKGGEGDNGGCASILYAASPVRIEHNVFENCAARKSGGALYVLAVTGGVSILNTSFVHNSANDIGGALTFVSSRAVAIRASLFQENTASCGGAVAMVSSDFSLIPSQAKDTNSIRTAMEGKPALTVENTVFRANEAKPVNAEHHVNMKIRQDGGALFVLSTVFALQSCTLHLNRAEQYGGGIFVEDSEVIVSASTVNHNVLSAVGSTGGGGAGISCLKSKVHVADSNITDNNAGEKNGGGGWFTFCSLTSGDSSWQFNRASDGGGMYYGMMSTIKIRSSYVSSNSASTSGGGIFCNSCSELNIQKSYFANNEAQQSGGAVNLLSTPVAKFTSVGLDNNVARNGGGGAVNMFRSLFLDIQTSSLTRNRAPNGGGGGILWGFYPSDMRRLAASSLPIKLLQVSHSGNEAAYGDWVASVEHSLFMSDGPVDPLQTDVPASLIAEGNRAYLGSSAGDWGFTSGGNVFSYQGRFLQVALVDWYNQIVRTSTTMIKLSSPHTLSGEFEVLPSEGIAVYKNFKIVARPTSVVQVLFESTTTTLVRGRPFQTILRNCTQGEHLDAVSMACVECKEGTSNGLHRHASSSCTPCLPGEFQDERGKAVCNACPAGQFQENAGQVSCESCKLGKYTGMKTTKSECVDCVPGMAGGDIPGICEPCSKGKIAADGAMAECTSCGSGQYSSIEGGTTCHICPAGRTTNGEVGYENCNCDSCLCEAGTFKNRTELHCRKCSRGSFSLPGASSCILCSHGRYSTSGQGAATLRDGCTKCRVGRYAPFEGTATGCGICPAGKYAPYEAMVECKECPSGYFISEQHVKEQKGSHGPRTSCYQCETGKWTRDLLGSTKCFTCESGEEYDEVSRKCRCLPGADRVRQTGQPPFSGCLCKDGQYPQLTDGQLKECSPCPKGAICRRPNSTHVSRDWLKAQEYFWYTPAEWNIRLDMSFLPCPQHCASVGCKGAAAGVLCQLCKDGHGKRFGECAPCDTGSLAAYITIVVVVALFLLFLIWRVRKAIYRNRKYTAVYKDFMRILKISVDFMQISSAMPGVLSVPLPTEFLRFSHTFDIINVDFISVTGASCAKGVNFMHKFGLISMLPICALLAGVFFYAKGQRKQIDSSEEAVRDAAHEMFIMIDEDHNGTVDQREYKRFLSHIDKSPVEHEMTEAVFTDRILALDGEVIMKWWRKQREFAHALKVSFYLFLLMHTPVTRKVFEAINCQKVHNRSFLKADYSIECNTFQFKAFLGYVLFIGISFTFGFPILIGAYLFRKRRDLDTGNVQAKVGFLYAQYRKGSEGWEVHEIVRKILLTGAIISLQERPTVQVGVALMICGIALSTLNFLKPHKNPAVFWLTQASFVITSFKFFSVLILLTSGDKLEESFLGSLMIAMDCIFFLSSIGCILFAISILHSKIELIRLQSTGLTKVIPLQSEGIDKNAKVRLLAIVRKEYGAGHETYLKLLSMVENPSAENLMVMKRITQTLNSSRDQAEANGCVSIIWKNI